MPFSPRPAIVALAWTLALTGLAAARSPLRAQFPTLSPDLPPGEGVAVACRPDGVEGPARCGRFRVWEDREAGAGRTLDLAFVVLGALGEPAEPDPVILLPGGPGQAYTAAAGPISQGLAALRDRRDILLVDVRGVGRSGELACDVPYPSGPLSRFGTPFPPDHIAACRDALMRRTDLAHYTTASTVDDLDELRAWLGYPRVNLNGGSYGTRVAQVYLRRHPESVRTAVLNGVAPIAEPLYVQHAALLQRALDRLLAECEAEAACSSDFPGLRADLDRLLERFADGPVSVEAGGSTVSFGAGDLSYALRGLLYTRGAELPRLLTRAAAGEVAPLADYYLDRTAWVGESGGLVAAGYHFSVLCAEDIAVLTDERVAEATAGTFMGSHLIDAYRAICDLWPEAVMPAEHWENVRSDVPTLLLSGARDPVTPPEGAVRVARGLDRSLHVVVPNGGHGVGGACVGSLIVALVRTGSVDGLDPSCIDAAPPTRFARPR
jgi:pimeloyl-ACP methyl ester carboxylesterase